MGVVALVAGAAGALAAAGLFTACLRLSSPLSFVLGTFVVAWATAVTQTMLLSVVRSWTSGWLLVAIAATLAVALCTWGALGCPRPPLAGTLPAARNVLRDPILAILCGAVAVAYGYLAVVALAIPPMDPDVLAYHLPRIVLWIQQQAVAPIPNAPGANLDANPPAAEIGQALGPLLTSSDRYASLFQMCCALVGALTVTGIARRLGWSRAKALFGGLVFAAFPIVALQAPTRRRTTSSPPPRLS